jgi:hypothetical protein
MGVLQRFGDLPHQAQSHADVELRSSLTQKQVEALSLRIMLKDRCRPVFVLDERFGPEDAGMFDPLQPQKFAFGWLSLLAAAERCRWPWVGIAANPTGDVRKADADSLPVLVLIALHGS